MPFSEHDYLTPPQLAEILGVHESTVKRWVNRGFLKADVTKGGHRRITHEQLQEFIHGYPQYAESSYVLSRLFSDYSGADAKELLDEYYDCLLMEDVEESRKYVQKLYSAKVSAVELANLLLYAINKLDSDLKEKAISLYQQKRMLVAIREDAQAILQLFPNPPAECSRVAMIAGVQGETDDVSLTIMEIVLRSRGWCVRNIGINLGNSKLHEAAEEMNPDLICLSKERTMPMGIGCFYQLAAMMRKQDKPFCAVGSGWPNFLRRKAQKAEHNILYITDMVLLDRFLMHHES